ncbi:MAG: aliphatic sulfonates family transporter, periplasmic ligand-binding protein [Acidimicrobiales bacterium]|jgi:NitT/TauT family transport system substrate-binding protein|nr:aliphatic sulfonates family transporter, periplasmic ligand-binding protein [Acidimicrobiales bacterium]
MRRRTPLAIILLVTVALVAVACGKSSKTSTASTATTAAASATTSPSTGGKITIGFSAWPGWFPWQVAKEKGFFTAAGLDVDMKYFEGYLDSLNALASGQLDGNSQTLNDTLSSVAGGAKQVIVLVNDNSTGNDQIIVSKDVTKVADLRGKSLAAEQGTVDHYLLLLGLKKAGLGPSDVKFQPLETGAAAAAFASGRLDGVGVFAPFTTQAMKRSGSHALFTSADFPGAIPDHLVLTADFVQKRPADVQKLVDVWFKTLDWIKANHTEAVSIMAKRAGVSTADYETYDKGTTIFTLDQNLEAFAPGSTVQHLDQNARQISDFLLSVKLIDKAPDLTGLFNDTFVKAHKG